MGKPRSDNTALFTATKPLPGDMAYHKLTGIIRSHENDALEDEDAKAGTLKISDEKLRNNKKTLEEKQADGNLVTREESNATVAVKDIVATDKGSVSPVNNRVENKAKDPVKSKADIDKEKFKQLLRRLNANIDVMFKMDGRSILDDDNLKANFRKLDSDLGLKQFNLDTLQELIHYADVEDLQTLAGISNKLQKLTDYLTRPDAALNSNVVVPLSFEASNSLLEYLNNDFGFFLILRGLVCASTNEDKLAITQALSTILNNKNTGAGLVRVPYNHVESAATDSKLLAKIAKDLNKKPMINNEHAGTYWTGRLLKNKSILRQCSAKTLLNLIEDKPNQAIDLAKGISDSKTASASNFIRKWWFRLTNKFPIEFAAKFDKSALLKLIDNHPETLSVFLKNKQMHQLFTESISKTPEWARILAKHHRSLIPQLWQEAKIQPGFLADTLVADNSSKIFIDAFRFIFSASSNNALKPESMGAFLTILSGNGFAYAALGIPFSMTNLEGGQAAASVQAFLQQQGGGINNAKIGAFADAMLELNEKRKNTILINAGHKAVIEVFARIDGRLLPMVSPVTVAVRPTTHQAEKTEEQVSPVATHNDQENNSFKRLT